MIFIISISHSFFRYQISAWFWVRDTRCETWRIFGCRIPVCLWYLQNDRENAWILQCVLAIRICLPIRLSRACEFTRASLDSRAASLSDFDLSKIYRRFAITRVLGLMSDFEIMFWISTLDWLYWNLGKD